MSTTRVALVTGAGNGIGRACVEQLRADNHGIVAVDLTADSMAWMAADDDIVRVVGDIADPDTSDRAVEEAEQRFGRLDCLILNAGIAGRGGLEDMDLERARLIYEVDVWGVVHGLRAGARLLRLSPAGSVVVTSSVSGLGADPRHWAYGSAKAAAVNLVRNAAWELAADGVRVNAVAPGPVVTGLTGALQEREPERFEELRAGIPLGRWGRADEVASVICFLASPQASFVTGVTVPVDGGLSAGSGLLRPGASA